jgi:membrane-bound lytic murein transglycosylase D
VLKEMNPELRYQILPENNYTLRVPVGEGERLLASLERIPVSKPPQRAYVYHRVRSGETLSTIARRHRTSVSGIMRANNLRRSNYIVAGKILKIPLRGYSAKQTVRVDLADGQTVKHVVRKGDSLWIIARRYGTTVNHIRQLNGLASNMLKKGQVLLISGGGKAKPSVEGLATYEVRPGDSPFLIAQRHQMKLERLLHLNQLYPGVTIYPGQELVVE